MVGKLLNFRKEVLTADGVKADAAATRQADAAATLASILAYGVTKWFLENLFY